MTKTTPEYDAILNVIKQRRNIVGTKLTPTDALPFNDMSDSLKSACSRFLKFVANYPHESEFPFEAKDIEPELSDRILASKLFMYWLMFDTNDPRYSSYLLEKSVEAIRQTPGSGGKEILLALIEMIQQYDIKLYKASNECPVGARYFIIDLCKTLGWLAPKDIKNDCCDIINMLIANRNKNDTMSLLTVACYIYGTIRRKSLPRRPKKILHKFINQDRIWNIFCNDYPPETSATK